MWPSGKAPGSGPVIGGSNPSTPATKRRVPIWTRFFVIVVVRGLNTRSDRGETRQWRVARRCHGQAMIVRLARGVAERDSNPYSAQKLGK